MDKAQAIHNFWSGFELKAYDESTVPIGDDAPSFPYITYTVETDSFENVLSLTGSIWYRTSSWEGISNKAEEISEAIINMNPPSIKIDGGRLYITKGTPFAQRMADPSDDMIRRIFINLQAEFFTES